MKPVRPVRPRSPAALMARQTKALRDYICTKIERFRVYWISFGPMKKVGSVSIHTYSMYVGVDLYLYTYMFMLVLGSICIYIYIHVYVCMYVCMYV